MNSPEAPPLLIDRRARLGILTLNRPQALNALSLDMVRRLAAQLAAWRDDAGIAAVVLRGAGRPGKAPAFCAGGDIRFFHQGVLAGDPRVEDFFTEEYALDHLVHRYPKPVIALLDGVTMGGGMGISQGCALRVVTEHSRLAMPETHIGLFPDVGGGWFLSRMAGGLGEYLGLTGHALGAADALAVGWADIHVPSARLDDLVRAVAEASESGGAAALAAARAQATEAGAAPIVAARPVIDRVFALPTLQAIVDALAAEPGEFAAHAAALVAQRSPLMMAVTLEQIRRARGLGLADDLRLERGMMRHCFHLRGRASETLEGIRALAVDKDQRPRWQPATVADVDPAEVAAYFASPWPAALHPLRDLA